jgi:hypothetical protein
MVPIVINHAERTFTVGALFGSKNLGGDSSVRDWTTSVVQVTDSYTEMRICEVIVFPCTCGKYHRDCIEIGNWVSLEARQNMQST